MMDASLAEVPTTCVLAYVRMRTSVLMLGVLPFFCKELITKHLTLALLVNFLVDKTCMTLYIKKIRNNTFFEKYFL